MSVCPLYSSESTPICLIPSMSDVRSTSVVCLRLCVRASLPSMYLCANKWPVESKRLQAVICSCACLLLKQSSGFCAATKEDLP